MKLIKKYIKSQTPKNLHKLRIESRKKLSFLHKEGINDIGLENILKNSSKLRDTDVMLKICKSNKIRKNLKKRRKKLNKKFIKFLKHIEFKQTTIPTKIKIDIVNCKEILKDTFLDKTDKFLHKLRLQVKACRYTNKDYEKEFKKLQDTLGKAHDYYKCEKLSKKFKINILEPYLKKKEYILKAEEIRKELLSILP